MVDFIVRVPNGILGRKGGSRTLILTKKQEEGLKIAVARHRAHEKYTVIAGYA